MAYTINKTDGSLFATVADGTIDNTTSSLIMIGKNYAGYGEALNENYVRLLESHANITAPPAPQLGQLWFDSSSSGVLTVYNGTEFKELGMSTSSATEPATPTTGDVWFDTVNSQLNVYDGTNYVLVGPAFSSGAGTSGALVETVTDTTPVDHIVIKLYVSGTVVAIVSQDTEFTPATPDPGFAATIKPGIQLADNLSGNIPQFVGTATDSLLVGGQPSTDFLSAVGNDSTTGTLSILNNSGLTVGSASDVTLSAIFPDVTLRNNNTEGDLILAVTTAGAPTPVITMDGATGRARVLTPLAFSDVANMGYVDNELSAYLPTAGGLMSGNIAMGTNLITDVVDPVNLQDAATKNYTDTTTALYTDTTTVALDGSRVMTGALAMGTNLITDVVDPVNLQDAATKNYIDTKIAAEKLAGWVSAGGTINYAIGTFTTSQLATGRYLVTHNLGHTNYIVNCTIRGASTAKITTYAQDLNTFEVRAYAAGSATLANAAFNFILLQA